jgi:L-ascorbate metabolism protein UlaG (beta-lactamase superfamily)
VFLLVIALNIASGSFGQEHKMINEIKEHDTGTAIWWAGHDSWLIKTDKLLIANDLYLQEEGRIDPLPVTAEELAPYLDLVFITHEHDDHFHARTCQLLAEKSKCMFILPESCIEKANKLRIPEERRIIAQPRKPFELKGIKVEPLRAIHTGANFAILYDANLQDCGYLLTIKGKKFLQPGDSYLLEDHLRLKNVNVLFFSPTEHNTYIDASLILINTLNPDYIFPQHHSTVKVDETNRFWAKGYPDEVKIRLSQAMKEKYHILKPGDKTEIK